MPSISAGASTMIASYPLISTRTELEVIKQGEQEKCHPEKAGRMKLKVQQKSADAGCGCHFFNSTRFVVLALSLATLTFSVANPLILNFTVICMDDVVQEYRRLGGNETIANEELHWLKHPVRRNLMFSAVAMGNFIGTLPATAIIQRLGTRYLLLIYGLISAVSTLFFPLAVMLDIYWLLLLTRFFQGMGQSHVLPANGALASAWAPLSEASVYIAVLSLVFQLSSIFTMPVSGFFCESPALGWRSVFYLQGAMTAALAVAFCLFYTNDPQNHPCVSSKENQRISFGKKEGESMIKGAVPYLSIMRTPTILAVWLACFGGNAGFWLLAQFGPIYLNQVLGLAVSSTGLAAATPFIFSAIFKLVVCPLASKASFLSETARVLFFAFCSQGFMAISYCLMASTTSATFAQTLYTATIVASGLNVIGTTRCAQLVARQYMSFVMSVVNVILCAVNLLLPAILSVMISVDSTREQWSLLFYGTAGVIAVTTAPFFFLVSTEAAPWTSSASQKDISEAVKKEKLPDDISKMA